jgi:hypothetical protein
MMDALVEGPRLMGNPRIHARVVVDSIDMVFRLGLPLFASYSMVEG